MKFPDASGVPANMLPANDGSAFDQLKHWWKAKAQPGRCGWARNAGNDRYRQRTAFQTDAKTYAILDRAAKRAYKMSRVIGLQGVVGGRSFQVYPDRHWVNPYPMEHPIKRVDAGLQVAGSLESIWTLTPGSGCSLTTTQLAQG